jgi:hypothetical protein
MDKEGLQMKKDDKRMSKKDLVVYWSPSYNKTPEDFDWNMMYTDPVSLIPHLQEIKDDETENIDSYLYCPAFKDAFRNTFQFSNSSIESTYAWNSEALDGAGAFLPVSKSYVDLQMPRKPTVKDTRMVQVALAWNFFCEEPLIMEVTPPFFSNSSHARAASIIPGRFDIGRWFRPVNADFQVWGEDTNEFSIKKDEPMFYVRFATDRRVVLKRFEITPEIYKIGTSILRTRNLFGGFRALESRYSDFVKSRTHKIVLKLIKESLLED